MESPGSWHQMIFELLLLLFRTWTVLWSKTRTFEILRDSPVLFWFPMCRLMIGQPYLFVCALAINMFIILAANMFIILAANMFVILRANVFIVFVFALPDLKHFLSTHLQVPWMIFVNEISMFSETCRTMIKSTVSLQYLQRISKANNTLQVQRILARFKLDGVN